MVRSVTGVGRALRLTDHLHDETISNVGDDLYDDSRSIISSRPISISKNGKSQRTIGIGGHEVRELSQEDGLVGKTSLFIALKKIFNLFDEKFRITKHKLKQLSRIDQCKCFYPHPFKSYRTWGQKDDKVFKSWSRFPNVNFSLCCCKKVESIFQASNYYFTFSCRHPKRELKLTPNLGSPHQCQTLTYK